MGQEMTQKPIVLQTGKFTEEEVNSLKANNQVFEIADIYERQLVELFKITYPGRLAEGQELEKFKQQKGIGPTAGCWVYYPWSGIFLHCLAEADLFALRTNRNQMLITKNEQSKLRQSVVGVAGMSVGAGIALALVYSGISQSIKIADHDELDTSNLNRLREKLSSVGKPKVDLVMQHIYELDPFADVQVFKEGLDTTNVDKFFSDPKLNVVIDEVDDFKMKLQLRLYANKHRTPVLMFTSLGDNILIDVERYDLEPDLKIFHGLLGDLTNEIVNKSEITKDDERRYAVLLVGQEYIPTRALASLPEIGRTLVGRPQLYNTVAVDSGLAAYAARQIILSDKPASGRYFIKFSDLLGISGSDLSQTAERENILKKLWN